MKRKLIAGVITVANHFSQLGKGEASEIKGGIRDVEAGGCGCCLCKPNASSQGAGNYTATRSGN